MKDATENLQVILDDHDCETVAQLAHNAYKYTDCGAALGVKLVTGKSVYSELASLDKDAPIVALYISSIVEGVEQTTQTVTVDLLDETIDNFAAAYDRALETVETEADEIWRATHGCPTCAKHFGNVSDNGVETCEGDDGMTPIWDECPDCGGDGSVI